MPITRQELEGLLPLIAPEVRLLSGSFPSGDGTGDLDLATGGLDFLWPLRLSNGWRICQFRNYDHKAWVWVLDRNGDVAAIDTLQDASGIGRYGFPTALATDHPGIEVRAWVKAAYLTLKRLRKGALTLEEWLRIRKLADEDWSGFHEILSSSMGPGVAEEVERALQGSKLPDARLRRRVCAYVFLRRFRTPLRVSKGVFRGAQRWLGRALRPTGLLVVIAGPDGSGKSTLASQLPEVCRGLFLRYSHFHWRPHILPGPGTVLKREAGDPTQPHGRPPHPRALSLILLAYYWFDFLLGYWIRIWVTRARTGAVIMERGWHDMVVDSRRYRLQAPPRLVVWLGAWLPKPDLTLVLEAPADTLLERKRELPKDELERQTTSWRKTQSERANARFLDASAPQGDVLSQARSAVVDYLEARTLARLGGGWLVLPTTRSPRWLLPRSPRAAASAGLRLYQPVTHRALLGWETARVASMLGGFKALPRGSAPPPDILRVLAPHLPRGTTVSVLRANHPGRYVAMLVNSDGDCLAVAKLATDAPGRTSLSREAYALRELAPHLPRPVVAPRLLHQEEGLLLVEAFRWRPRRSPWRMPEEVARALGILSARTFTSTGRSGAHGDCAPWNLLACDGFWGLVDWEESTSDALPFFDVFHFLVQSHSLLGRPSRAVLMDGIINMKGWVGSVISAYSEGAKVSAQDATSVFPAYLESTRANLDSASHDGQAGIKHRTELLRAL